MSDEEVLKKAYKEYMKSTQMNDEFLRQPVDAKLKVNMDGFRSSQDKFSIAEDLSIERGSILEREGFFQRAAAFNKTYAATEYNEFFATFSFQTTRGSLSGLTPANRLAIISSFLAVCCSHSIQANVGQLLVSQNSEFVSAGFFQTPFELVSTGKPNQLTDSEIALMTSLWVYFKKEFIESQHFSLIARRYFYSLTRNQWEDRLIDLIVALEAFFLPEKQMNQSNKGGKIAKRLSRLLRNHWSRDSVIKITKQCYDVRNDIVHGDIVANLENETRGRIEELSLLTKTAIQEYLIKYPGLSIIKFVEIIDKMD